MGLRQAHDEATVGEDKRRGQPLQFPLSPLPQVFFFFFFFFWINEHQLSSSLAWLLSIQD